MKKRSDFSRLMGYAGGHRVFTYASLVLSAASALVALVPFVYIWKILRDVLDTPVSPELLPPDANGKIAQKTEEKIGPYELHDFFLYHFVRFGFDRKKLAVLAEKAFDGQYDRPTIDRWLTEFLRRFFISQFKRSCIPDSPKVGSVSLSPRGDWRMPSDAAMQAFLQPDERI